ncbi:AAA family ATPase [Roseivivax sp. THAF30]|uniref:GumC family protein n=1 Tax=Roseivivax sp. THAF30 TaxID=2587852 RepID=UPI0012AA3D97|nr:AAA family ATPase [Roseivivax sp. THAF30]QFT63702.1 Tyrosine-protein kinase etk [Roseivivax sp. THAF30]
MTAQESFTPMMIESSQSSDERIGVAELLVILRRQAKIAVFIVLAVMSAALYYLSTVEERFVTRAMLVLTQQETRIDRALAQLESFDLSRSIVETELDVLRSREFAASLAERLSLDDEPAFARAADAPPISEAERQAELIDKLLASYSVSRSGESLAIEIVAETADPELTAAIANGVAETYIQRTTSERRSEIQRSVTFLEARVEEMSADVGAMEMKIADFVRENNLDDPTRLNRLVAEQMRLQTLLTTIAGDPGRSAEVRRSEADLVEAEDRLRRHTSASLSLGGMERALELEQTRYQQAISRLYELETQLDFVPRSARHVTEARVPVEADWPNTKVALALSFLAAVILAFVASLLFEALNRRVWSEMDIKRLTGLTNVGSVARIPRRGIMRRKPTPLQFLSTDPRSVFNEGLRGILTLWLNVYRTSRSKVIMVTSSLPNEGKSTVALSLAGSAARDGLRVLVLDLDVHDQGVTELAGDKRASMSLQWMVDKIDNIDKEEDPPELGEPPIMRHASEEHSEVGADEQPRRLAEGLDLVTVGAQGRLNPHLLMEVKAKLFPHLRTQYDLIVIDTPPVLVLNDACRFGSLADAVLVVVRWGRTKSDELRETHARLNRSGAHVFGTILNDVDPRKQLRYHTGGYLGSSAYGKTLPDKA